MNKAHALQFRDEFIEKHPQHKSEVRDLYLLMLDEIDEGGSEMNEVSLFINSCKDLLTEE
jgi:hypothetical protein